jgi:hypothetical protein
MLYVSWPPVRNSWSIRETSPDPGGLARYPIKTVILICFVLLALQGVSEVIKKVAFLRGDLPSGGAAQTGSGQPGAATTNESDPGLGGNRREGTDPSEDEQGGDPPAGTEPT